MLLYYFFNICGTVSSQIPNHLVSLWMFEHCIVSITIIIVSVNSVLSVELVSHCILVSPLYCQAAEAVPALRTKKCGIRPIIYNIEKI